MKTYEQEAVTAAHQGKPPNGASYSVDQRAGWLLYGILQALLFIGHSINAQGPNRG